MTDYTDNYKNLLIKQYWENPNAVAETELKAAQYEKIYTLLRSFETELDIDLATGDRLDKIGAIVGLDRVNLIPYFAQYFGFDENANSLTFGTVADPLIGGTFYSVSLPASIQVEFTDDEYRFYLKAKISVNSSTAYLLSDDRISIQDVLIYLFNGLAYAVDNLSMSMTLMVDTSLDSTRVRIANELGLLTTPQGVRYNALIFGDEDFFGFEDDPNATGFGDLVSASEGGEWATLIV